MTSAMSTTSCPSCNTHSCEPGTTGHKNPPPPHAIDIEDYEAIGTFRQALSIHAEEAYEEVGNDDAKKVAERIFKALTDTFSDSRGIRRPTSIGDLAAITPRHRRKKSSASSKSFAGQDVPS